MITISLFFQSISEILILMISPALIPVLIRENFDEAYEAATKFALENNKEFIHPFVDGNHNFVICSIENIGGTISNIDEDQL